jgi:hypothetical protein
MTDMKIQILVDLLKFPPYSHLFVGVGHAGRKLILADSRVAYLFHKVVVDDRQIDSLLARKLNVGGDNIHD